jgi:hypothetical protein
MRPRTIDTATHERLIEALRVHAQEDARIRAAWLEGSFARGTADAGSDLDLHLAVEDEAFEAFCDGAREWMSAVSQPHGNAMLRFGARRMFSWTLDDWVRFDLFLEPASSVAGPARPVEPRVLFDRDGLTSTLRVAPEETFDAAAHTQRLIEMLLSGFTFPARLAAREEWGSLQLNALLVIFQFIVPAMLLQRHPEQAFRPHLHNERFLDADQRERTDALVSELARAFATLPPEEAAVRDVHATLETTLLAELRAAAEAHDVPWPEEAEATVRRFLRDELAIDLG